MGSIAGLLAELLLIFQDFKFWRNGRKQRKYEQKHRSPIKRWLRRLPKVLLLGIIIVLTFYFVRFSAFLFGNADRQTTKKLTQVASLLKHEKETSGHYPEELASIVRNNPLHKNIYKDYWGREFFYERHPSGERYILISLGADGKLNTPDDIAYEFEID
ncbi:type II secretion system protein GspG [Gelidibacter pelagius]|uniref:Type II secretion system protein GspG n=1 Tax=Gelidibacter pelagius TaxID=2819985 RepID=A0ABS3SNR7_9FLAO|nr:type II secretion system protein GspG [Gelidibacter pelagius]MBO3097345.1 type II secretion system protein GspG [Gelidibacter pelagius]